METRQWKRENYGVIKEPVLEYLEKIFDEEIERGHDLRVCVGTDSQKSTDIQPTATQNRNIRNWNESISRK